VEGHLARSRLLDGEVETLLEVARDGADGDGGPLLALARANPLQGRNRLTRRPAPPTQRQAGLVRMESPPDEVPPERGQGRNEEPYQEHAVRPPPGRFPRQDPL